MFPLVVQKLAPRPEVAAPVTFAKLRELHLHAVRGTAFDPAHKVADRDMWWYLDKHVDMLSGQNARDDLHAQFPAHMSDDGAYSFTSDTW